MAQLRLGLPAVVAAVVVPVVLPVKRYRSRHPAWRPESSSWLSSFCFSEFLCSLSAWLISVQEQLDQMLHHNAVSSIASASFSHKDQLVKVQAVFTFNTDTDYYPLFCHKKKSEINNFRGINAAITSLTVLKFRFDTCKRNIQAVTRVVSMLSQTKATSQLGTSNLATYPGREAANSKLFRGKKMVQLCQPTCR